MKKPMRLSIMVVVLALFLFGCTNKEQSPQDPASDVTLSDSSGLSESSSSSESSTSSKKASSKKEKVPVTLKQFAPVKKGTQIVSLETNMGVIKIALFPAEAPQAVENFLALVNDGYYNGLNFYRVADDYMIQSGEQTLPETNAPSVLSEPIEDEFSPNLGCFRGALVRPQSGDHTNPGQFYIVQRPFFPKGWDQALLNNGYPQEVVDKYVEVGGIPERNFKDTVFGQVIEGMDVVDAIAKVQVEFNESTKEKTKPTTDVRIKTAKTEKYKASSKNKDSETQTSSSDVSSAESIAGGM